LTNSLDVHIEDERVKSILQINIMRKILELQSVQFQSDYKKVNSRLSFFFFSSHYISSKMRISSFFTVIFVVATTAQTDFCAGNKDTAGYCETLTYIDRTLNATDAPLASDCQDACRGVLSDAGDWLVDFKGTLRSLACFFQLPTLPSSIHVCFLLTRI
jgi:hypothetical protein